MEVAEVLRDEAVSGALPAHERPGLTDALGMLKDDDPGDPMRTAMRQMAGVFAELDRAMTVRRLRDGRKAKQARGGKAVGRYGYGYSKEGPISAELEVMRSVLERRDRGDSWKSLAAESNSRGLNPRSAVRWTPQNLAKVMAVQRHSL